MKTVALVGILAGCSGSKSTFEIRIELSAALVADATDDAPVALGLATGGLDGDTQQTVAVFCEPLDADYAHEATVRGRCVAQPYFVAWLEDVAPASCDADPEDVTLLSNPPPLGAMAAGQSVGDGPCSPSSVFDVSLVDWNPA